MTKFAKFTAVPKESHLAPECVFVRAEKVDVIEPLSGGTGSILITAHTAVVQVSESPAEVALVVGSVERENLIQQARELLEAAGRHGKPDGDDGPDLTVVP